MGAPKAALPLGAAGETFLSYQIRQLQRAGLPDIVVVTGAAVEAVRRAAGRVRLPVRFAHNSAWADGQLTSLLTGVRERPTDAMEAAMMCLVDAPFAAPETIALLIGRWRRGRAPIVRPARGDVHGHPVIFDRVLFDELLAADPRVGAKAVVRAHAGDILYVPVKDGGAFIDVDTPADYDRIRGDFEAR
jgi:CTP:molybdopterin cytidylyltransferase MocA